MFEDAYEKATKFTHPIILSILRLDNSIENSLGAFVLVNSQGWMLTAAHIVSPYFQAQKDAAEIHAFETRKSSIENNAKLDLKTKKKQISHLKANPKWIKNHSFWPGFDNARISRIVILGENDIALCKVDNIPADPNRVFPKFFAAGLLRHGMGLCKIGFPFHNIVSTYDQTNGSFNLAPDALPVPFFLMEGIYTREALVLNTDLNKTGRFIETSTPGLKGQSGGPIVNTQGQVVGIQSQTFSLPLGFSPIVERNGRKIEENQFINVGIGVHPEVIRKLMTDNGVAFEE